MTSGTNLYNECEYYIHMDVRLMYELYVHMDVLIQNIFYTKNTIAIFLRQMYFYTVFSML